MDISGFSQESLDFVQQMLYNENQTNPLAGQCGQRKKRQAMHQLRTPAEKEADRARAQASKGKNNVGSAARSGAAKKAAETRRRCRGSKPSTPTNSTTV